MESRPLSDLLDHAMEQERLANEAARLQRETGLKLRDARAAAGLSQASLASLAGVTQPYVSAIEHGDGISTSQLRHFHAVIATASTGETATVSINTSAKGAGRSGKRKSTRGAKARP